MVKYDPQAIVDQVNLVPFPVILLRISSAPSPRKAEYPLCSHHTKDWYRTIHMPSMIQEMCPSEFAIYSRIGRLSQIVECSGHSNKIGNIRKNPYRWGAFACIKPGSFVTILGLYDMTFPIPLHLIIALKTSPGHMRYDSLHILSSRLSIVERFFSRCSSRILIHLRFRLCPYPSSLFLRPGLQILVKLVSLA